MALLDLQGMEPSAPQGHGHGGHASSASLLICVASSLSLVTCL
ncbi:MAG TPA: SapB/AmfS family lanthipeptide [Rugosimonospora sp.]|jgi:hypothetical protein